MGDGPGPAIVVALMVGTVATFALCVRLLVWAISWLMVVVQG